MSYLLQSPTEFFKDSLTRAAELNAVKLQEETEFYLVKLLTSFINSDYLFTVDADGNYSQEPLALLFKDAVFEEKMDYRAKILQKIGDVSLYVSGFFYESFNKKLIDVDYYIDMGKTAYSTIKTLPVKGRQPPVVYDELVNKFEKILDIFGEIANSSGLIDNTNLLRQYEVWQKTGSGRIARLLKEKGIIPVSTNIKTEN